MKQLKEVLNGLPDTDKVLIILSGGMDSTIAMRLAVERYGAKNVYALSFFYGQKQQEELIKAMHSTKALGVNHNVFDLSVLGAISKGFSANVDTDMDMPTIKDVLGDPTPKTYVPNRNMILISIAAAYAEKIEAEYVFMGLQIHDEYGYWDTTGKFVDSINEVLKQNRKIKIKLCAPFCEFNKQEEIQLLLELDGNVDLLKNTLTCYNPNKRGESCGVCPSCSERIANFKKAGIKDPIAYSKDIVW